MDINKTEQTTDNLLESMLLEYANAKELVSEGVKEVIKATAINASLKESLMEDDDMAGEEEADDAAEIEDETPEVDEVEADQDGEEMPDYDSDEDDMDGEAEEEIPAEEPVNPLAEFEPDENGDYDLTGVTDLQKIIDIAKNVPDGTEFVMVKKSAFDVSVDTNSQNEPELETELPAGEIEDEGEEAPMGVDTDGESTDDYEADDNDYGDEEEGDEDDKPLNVGESVNKKKGKQTVNEGNFAKVLKIKNDKIAIYEQKIRQLQKALKETVAQKKAVETNFAKVKVALTEGKEVIQGLSLINKNMVNIAKLFMENATTKTEKKEILTAFNDKVKTLRESDLLFEFYSKNLSTRKNENAPSKDTLIENAHVTKLKKPVSKVHESATFKKKGPKSDFARFSEYKI